MSLPSLHDDAGRNAFSFNARMNRNLVFELATANWSERIEPDPSNPRILVTQRGGGILIRSRVTPVLATFQSFYTNAPCVVMNFFEFNSFWTPHSTILTL
jgi:hypothetical protein